MRLGSFFSQKCRDHHVFRNVHNLRCNQPHLVLLFGRDGEVQDCLHVFQNCRAAVLNLGHFVCKLAELSLFCLTDQFFMFSNSRTSLDLLMTLSEFDPSVQLSYRLQK